MKDKPQAVRIAIAAFLLALAAGCSPPQREEPPAAQTRVVQNTIEFAKRSPQLAAVLTAEAKPRGESITRLNGRIVWDEDRTVRIFPPLAGRVMSISVRPGDTVRAGQSLALVSAPELGQTQAEARKAEQDRVLAQKTLARIDELHKAGVSPAKELQAAQADLARSESELARTTARLKLYGAAAGHVDQVFPLRTPIAGVVVERNLNPGQELRPDQPTDRAPFVVSDPTRLWFVLDVAEIDVGVLKVGEQVALRSPLLGEGTATGRITHVADSVDPQSRTVKVRGTVENKDRRLKAEMYVTAEVRTGAAPGIVVPAKAVYLRGDRNFVFIESAPGAFTRRAVTLGAAYDGSQVILQGIKPDDKVVVDGALLLQRILAGSGSR